MYMCMYGFVQPLHRNMYAWCMWMRPPRKTFLAEARSRGRSGGSYLRAKSNSGDLSLRPALQAMGSEHGLLTEDSSRAPRSLFNLKDSLKAMQGSVRC